MEYKEYRVGTYQACKWNIKGSLYRGCRNRLRSEKLCRTGARLCACESSFKLLYVNELIGKRFCEPELFHPHA